MKFVCNRCGKLVTIEDVIIDTRDFSGFRLRFDLYCPACYERIQELKKQRVETVKQMYEEKNSKWWWWWQKR